MRRFASIAVVLFVFQAGLCGLRGFGGTATTGQDPAAAAAAHCATPSLPAPARGSEQGSERQCREHCEQAARALAASAPAIEASPVLMVAIRVPLLTMRLDRSSRLPHRAPAPPAVPLPILHSALLL